VPLSPFSLTRQHVLVFSETETPSSHWRATRWLIKQTNKHLWSVLISRKVRAVVQAVSQRPLTAAAWVRVQVNPVGFVVGKVALGQVFLRVLRFSPVNIIPPWAPLFRKLKKKTFIHSPLHSSSSGDGQKARKSGRSPVRRQSHPHNQNNRISCRRRISRQTLKQTYVCWKL
jgi:hypothetical protein